ncbi:MAG: phage major capsid protein, partial [Synergistales bacterium]|nr:phage major capsid protein [Synergistales bacterium]
NIMRRLCKTMNVRNDSQIPVLSSHGSASWKVEEAAYAESDPTLSAITFSAYKLTGLVKISEELMRDSMFDMGSFISDELARQFADAEETAFLTGNGSGKPTGLLQTAEIGKTTSSSTAFTGDELIDVYHALDKKYRNNSVWLAHDLVVAKLRKLKMSSDSTGGDKQYLWQPGLQAGQPDRVLGRPIYTAEDMDDTMTSGDSTFVLFDPSMYWIVDRGATYMQRLNELYAANGQIGFRGFRRMDGHLVFAEAAQKLVQS